MPADTLEQQARAYCEHLAGLFVELKALAPLISRAGLALEASLRSGGQILFCGNGGSASDAEHLAAELVGRYHHDRRALPAMALASNGAVLTALANDFDYEHVFTRQLQGQARRGDALVALSTSGRSPNVLNAVRWAREHAITTIALTGADGGELKNAAEIVLAVPARKTNHIQEMHIALGHILCGFLEDREVAGHLTPPAKAHNSRKRTRSIKGG